MQQKALLGNFPHLQSLDWTIYSNPSLPTGIGLLNNHTSDQFRYERQLSNGWMLHDLLRSRAIYTMPNTPQMIVGNVQQVSNDQLLIELLVQYGQKGLQKIMKNNSHQNFVLQSFKVVTKCVQSLVKKYGTFRITPNMVRITNNNGILVWISENYGSNHRQYPLSTKNIYDDYRLMIFDIFCIFQAAGCSRQIQSLRNKAECQRLLSFEKLKVFIENRLKNGHRSVDRIGKVFHSPEFLRKKGSIGKRDTQKSGTESFKLLLKPTNQGKGRFITSLTLGYKSPIKSQSSSKSNTSKQLITSDQGVRNQDNQRERFKPQTPTNANSARSMFIHFNSASKLQETVSVSSKTGSNTTQKVESNDSNINMKKKQKDFRETANSLTTTAFIGSMASSGKLKFTGLDDHNNSSSTSSLLDNKKSLASSFGVKDTKKMKQTFKVKISKIIEQNSEQVNTPHSFIKSDKQNNCMSESQIQRDFNGLLGMDHVSQHRPSNDLLELENEINNILLG